MRARQLLLLFYACCAILLAGFAAPARAAIGFVGADDAAGNVSSLSLSNPGIDFGEVMVAQIAYRSSSAVTVTAPTGWVQIGGTLTTSGSSAVRQALYYRVAGTTEPGSYAWTFSSTVRAAGVVVGFSGVDSMSPIDSVAGAVGDGDEVVAPSVTTSAAGHLLLGFFSIGEGGETVSTPSGMTSSGTMNITTGGTGLGVRAAYQTIASAGATGTRTSSASDSAPHAAHAIALRAATSGSGTTCFSDDFNRTSGLGSNWITTTNSGSFGVPVIVSNRLRMTDASTYVATAASLQRVFPAAGNYIQVQFDYYAYNGSGADGLAVIFSDAGMAPQPGGYGGSLGYANRSDGGGIPGFAGGWLGIGIDEWGNFSNPTEGRTGGPGSRAGAVSIRGSGSGQSGYRYVTGTASLSGGVSSDNSSTRYRYRITIDSRNAGQALVTVERDTGGGFSTVVSTFNILTATGQAAVPTNLALSFTSSTGASTNIHELDNLSSCAFSVTQLVTIGHYRIDLPSSALTCEPATIKVTACQNALAACTPYAGATVTLTPTGWEGGDIHSLPTGVSDLQLWRTSPGTATIGVSASTPPLKAFGTPVQCFTGGVASSCNLTYSDTGFELIMPDTTSCKPTTATLRAIRKADNTTACVANTALANTTAAVNFRQSFVNPATGTQSVSVNSIALPINGTQTPVNVSFNASAAANLTVAYPDAGQVQLDATYTQGVAGSQTLTLTGSDQFIAAPAGVVLYNTSLANSNPAIAPTSVAGQAFTLNARAVCWQAGDDPVTPDFTDNPTTPNFRMTGVPINSSATVVAPAGGQNGSVGVTSVDFAAADNGLHPITNQTVSEVGAFKFATNAFNYLGVPVPAHTGPTVGRFIPHHLDVTGATVLTNRSDLVSCTGSAFTYLGEDVTLAFTLVAENALGAVTQNYTGSFAKFTLSNFASYGFGARNAPTTGAPTDLSTRLAVGSANPTGTWANGQANVTARLKLNRLANPDGPFSTVQFGLAAIEPAGNDGVNMSAVFDTDIDNNGSSDHLLLRGTGAPPPPISTEFVFGRLTLGNAYGSELINLPVPIEAQSWDGVRFATRTNDSCTRFPASAVTLSNYQRNLAACETAVTPAAIQLTNGKGNIVLRAPGSGNGGSVNLSANLGATASGQACTAVGAAAVTATPANLPYLQGRWTPGVTTYDQNPSARASFGQNRGPLIYMRENF
jgi:MSHA biogenesis protein MshQ